MHSKDNCCEGRRIDYQTNAFPAKSADLLIKTEIDRRFFLSRCFSGY